MSSSQIIESLVKNSIEIAAEISPVFNDRRDAGYKLAELLKKKNYKKPVLITIPSGGIPVALPISERLDLPIHLAFAAKVRFSQDRRFGVGAVSSTGEALLNKEMLEDLPLDGDILEEGIKEAKLIIDEKIKELAGVTPSIPDLKGKTAILVEDGIATGYTVLAAIKTLELSRPDSVIIVSPVISDAANRKINNCGLELVFLEKQKGHSFLVDNYYHSFPQISVEDVRGMLVGQNHERPKVIYEATGN